MKKVDISKNELYLNKLINVIKSSNHCTTLQVRKGRYSDAFIYILSGSCTYSFDDNTVFTANGGDILYLAQSATYTMQIHSPDYEFIYCDFTFYDDAPRKSAVYTPKNFQEAKNLFEKLYRRYHASSQKNFSECMSLLYQIYGIIFQTENNPYFSKNTKENIAKAKDYIDHNFQDLNLSVSSLASRCKLSEAYFRERFKALYHVSPSQYIILLRIEKAKSFMEYPFLSLEECAQKSGFSSLQYFCRVFKKTTGITPAKYRKKFSENQVTI